MGPDSGASVSSRFHDDALRYTTNQVAFVFECLGPVDLFSVALDGRNGLLLCSKGRIGVCGLLSQILQLWGAMSAPLRRR